MNALSQTISRVPPTRHYAVPLGKGYSMKEFAESFSQQFGPSWLDHDDLKNVAAAYLGFLPEADRQELQDGCKKALTKTKAELVEFLAGPGFKIWTSFRRDLAVAMLGRDHVPLGSAELENVTKNIKRSFSEWAEGPFPQEMRRSNRWRLGYSVVFLLVGSAIIGLMLAFIPSYARYATDTAASDAVKAALQPLEESLAVLDPRSGDPTLGDLTHKLKIVAENIEKNSDTLKSFNQLIIDRAKLVTIANAAIPEIEKSKKSLSDTIEFAKKNLEQLVVEKIPIPAEPTANATTSTASKEPEQQETIASALKIVVGRLVRSPQGLLQSDKKVLEDISRRLEALEASLVPSPGALDAKPSIVSVADAVGELTKSVNDLSRAVGNTAQLATPTDVDISEVPQGFVDMSRLLVLAKNDITKIRNAAQPAIAALPQIASISETVRALATNAVSPVIILLVIVSGLFLALGVTSINRNLKMDELRSVQLGWSRDAKLYADLFSVFSSVGFDPGHVLNLVHSGSPRSDKDTGNVITPLTQLVTESKKLVREWAR